MPTLLQERPRTDAAHDPREVTVRVVTDPGGRGGGGRRRPRLGSLVIAAALLVLAGVVAVALGVATGLLHLSNPFATETVDRTPPAVLRRLESLSDYRAASANFEVNVDLEEKHGFIPGFVAGERVSFMGVGHVDATVDFDGIDAQRVVTSDGGESVLVTLPHARRQPAVVDPELSHVRDRDRGIADRLGGMFSDNPTGERELYRVAARKMDRAARESGVVAKAEANTERMLTRLLRRLGYDRVTVRYTDRPAAAAPAV
jgi:hypothetical protein